MSAYPEYSVIVCVVFVVGKVMLQDEQQNNAYGDAQGEAEDVQEREKFVFKEDPDEEFEVSAEHWGLEFYIMMHFGSKRLTWDYPNHQKNCKSGHIRTFSFEYVKSESVSNIYFRPLLTFGFLQSLN
jgi:hypothetical protein